MEATASSRAVPDPLTLRFREITAMLKPTTPCPAGAVRVRGASPRGNQRGNATLCLLRSKKIAPKTTLITSDATIAVQRLGELRAMVRIREVSRGSVARRTITGVVYPGSGDFRKSSGSVRGRGTVSFAGGKPKADLTFTFDFD